MLLTEFPLEITENIFVYLEIDDFRSFACCSSLCYEMVKHILWKDVNIPWEILCNPSSNQLNKLENLTYASSLCVYRKCMDIKKDEYNDNANLIKNVVDQCNTRKIIEFHFESYEYDRSVCGLHYALQKFQNLRELYLSNYNFMELDINLLHLVFLWKLSICSSSLNPRHLAEITNMKSLKTLQLKKNIYSNSFSCEDFSQIKSMNLLEKLTISDCIVIDDAVVKNFVDLHNLTELHLSFSKITDSSLALLTKTLSNIVVLNVRGCKLLTDIGISHIKDLSMVKSLDISRNLDITDETMFYLREVVELEKLDVSDTNVGDKGVTYIMNMKRLKVLKVSSFGNTVKITDHGAKIISSSFTSLENLEVSGNDVTDVGAFYLSSSLKSLRKLGICWNGITDVGLSHISHLSRLEKLAIIKNNISDEGLSGLINLKFLKKLYIDDNDISDRCLEYFPCFASLECLTFYDTTISPEKVRMLRNSKGKRICII